MSILDVWNNLEQQWKDAFVTTSLVHHTAPAEAEINQLFALKVLRFAGPAAPYPNMGFELTNLSGLANFKDLEILVVTHHRIKTIRELRSLQHLKSLFLLNNEIESLEGIENLTRLEQLFVQSNRITSLQPLEQLIRLKEVYVNNNLITSLDGITEAHSDCLESLYCKPNEGLRQKEIIYTENQLGIRCKSI